MLTELKRCNSVGNVEGLLFLVSMLPGKAYVKRQEVANRCALENGITINCSGAVAFFDYLGYVTSDVDKVIPTDKLNSLIALSSEDIIQRMIKDCITALIGDGIFDSDGTSFDVEYGRLSIKRSAFPLSYAAIRNFLTLVGALDKEENGEIGINESYEADFSSQLKNRKKKFTLEQLLANQEEQSRRGLEAEEFILRLEKERLPGKAVRIKRISDFDVSAGYDLVSFETEESVSYDRFIEVKCYLGTPHFYWSENESDVAKLKGDKYILYLVNYEKINNLGYEPEFIRNPYEVIFADDSWLVNTASYRVQKL